MPDRPFSLGDPPKEFATRLASPETAPNTLAVYSSVTVTYAATTAVTATRPVATGASGTRGDGRNSEQRGQGDRLSLEPSISSVTWNTDGPLPLSTPEE
jgi:hypothetical protein